MQALIINASPRKHFNTAQLLESAMKGAAANGCETEWINLYDYEFTGCRSCFACKIKNSQTNGLCAIRDSIRPILLGSTGTEIGRLCGYNEVLYSCDTYQFSNYSRYDCNMFSEEKKREHREKQFPVDLKRAYDLGARLAEKAVQGQRIILIQVIKKQACFGRENPMSGPAFIFIHFNETYLFGEFIILIYHEIIYNWYGNCIYLKLTIH